MRNDSDENRLERIEARARRLAEEVHRLRRDRDLSVQMEKEAAVGRLARGVAHEINNPLQSVLGFVQLLIQETRERGGHSGPESLAHLERIEESALRCKRIVDALLDFTRQSAGQPTAIDLLGLLELNLVAVRRTIEDNGARLVVRGDVGPCPVEGDPGQLTQALFNVLANARDAVADGGCVEIEIEIVAGRVVIAVCDDGPGIAEDDLARVFDPFFSTKDIGDGAGLGLCAARGILRAHGGDIRVASSPEGGARVELSLPLVEVDAAVGGGGSAG